MNVDVGKGYGCTVMALAGMACVLSVWSLLKWDNLCSFISGGDSLITALSVIVTLVMGWQIWQVIDLKNTKKEIMAEAQKISFEAQRDIHGDMAMHSAHLGLKYEEVYHLLWQIVYESKLGNYSQCDNLISRMDGIADFAVNDIRKSTLQSISRLIENRDKISRYNDISGIVNKLFS